MSRLRRLIRARDERGLTAFELVVGITIMFAITSGALVFMESAGRTIRVTSKETESLDQARVTLARMAGEIRRSVAVANASITCPMSSCLIVTVPDSQGGTIDVRYRYDQQDAALLRSAGDLLTGVWGGETPVATALVNGSSPVFCRNAACSTGNPGAVKVMLLVNAEPSKPAHAVRLESYITPRNT